MGQAHRIANLDRHEYLDPNAFEFASSQLCALNGSDGAMWGMTLLVAASNGKGSGDFSPVDGGSGVEPQEPDERTQALLDLVGRWAGQRVAIIGDYFDANTGNEYRVDEPADVWKLMSRQEGWVDISEHVVDLIELDAESRESRHEVHTATSGATYTIAQGFSHRSSLPVAPRSILHADGRIEAVPELPPVDPRTLPAEAQGLDEKQLVQLADLLSEARSMVGPLNEEYREGILLAAEHPCQMTWSAVNGAVVSGMGGGTLWNAVLEVDPTFPRSARRNEVNESVWERVPSGSLILEALQVALDGS